MKRLLALLVCGALVSACSGCAYAAAQAAQASENSYELYFARKNLSDARGGDAMEYEQVTVTDANQLGPDALARELMDRLLSGPRGEELQSPFPAGTQLLSLQVDGGRALVDLSGQYSTLSGVGLTLADYSITMTISQIPEIRSVAVTVRGQELAYRNKQNFMQSDVLLSTSEDVVSTVAVRLWFLSAGGELLAEPQTVELYEGDTQVEAVVSALLDGPEDRDLHTALPEGFAIQSVWTENNVCYVDLPSAAAGGLTDPAVLHTALTALSKSLCSLPTVAEVRFLVDGEQAEFYGGVEIGDPIAGESAG